MEPGLRNLPGGNLLVAALQWHRAGGAAVTGATFSGAPCQWRYLQWRYLQWRSVGAAAPEPPALRSCAITGCRMLAAYRILATGYWLLASDYGLVASDYWRVATG